MFNASIGPSDCDVSACFFSPIDISTLISKVEEYIRSGTVSLPFPSSTTATSLPPLVWDFGLGVLVSPLTALSTLTQLKSSKQGPTHVVAVFNLWGQGRQVIARNSPRNLIINPISGPLTFPLCVLYLLGFVPTLPPSPGSWFPLLRPHPQQPNLKVPNKNLPVWLLFSTFGDRAGVNFTNFGLASGSVNLALLNVAHLFSNSNNRSYFMGI